MPKTKSGFTIVELLIVIVVIAILAAISIVAYNGIQARANDSRIQAAVNQLEKAIQTFALETGRQPYSGSQSTGSAVNNACPSTTVASGWAAKGAYSCTIEHLLEANGNLPSNFLTSLPPNKATSATNGIYTTMLYQCYPTANNAYALYWYLQSPSQADLDSLTTVTSRCGQVYADRYSNGMRAARVVQL